MHAQCVHVPLLLRVVVVTCACRPRGCDAMYLCTPRACRMARLGEARCSLLLTLDSIGPSRAWCRAGGHGERGRKGGGEEDVDGGGGGLGMKKEDAVTDANKSLSPALALCSTARAAGRLSTDSRDQSDQSDQDAARRPL